MAWLGSFWDARINPLPIWGAIALHLIWGGLLLVTDTANGVTAISSLLTVTHDSRLLGIVLIGAAACSATALLDQRLSPFFRLLWLLPQQGLMTVTAGGCLHSMWLGRFADGVPRPVLFLVADQIPAVIFVAIYTLAVLRRVRTG